MGSSVSVVIPVYNGERYIAAAIRSALDQTLPPLEVIVVDDGSTDRTASEVAAFNSRVRSIRQDNAGVAAARNRGLELAQGEFCAFLDADDVWLPTKLELQVDAIESHPGAVATGCGLIVVDAQLENPVPIPAEPAGYEDLLMVRGDNGITSGSRLLARTEVMRRIGGFDTDLSTSADWDIALRLLAEGPVPLLEEPLMLYRQHGDNMHRGIHVMEADMLALLRKARDFGPAGVASLYPQAYGRVMQVVGASYWSTGSRLDALRCLVLAALKWPPVLANVVELAWKRIGGRP